MHSYTQYRIVLMGRMGFVMSKCRPFALTLPIQPISPVYRDVGSPSGSDGDPPTDNFFKNQIFILNILIPF